MSLSVDTEVLSILQPDLLTIEELVFKIQSRCRIKNLELMSKEGLVRLFRRVILPLPQRFYRANRRGKMLTSRRAKAGLEGRKKEEGCSVEGSSRRDSASSNRLKPPPNLQTHSHKIRLSSDKSDEKNYSQDKGLDHVIIRDRRKLLEDHRKESGTGRKICLKRASVEEKPSTESTSPTRSKKRRDAIKWP